jgi:hypothetical protein
MFSHIPLPLVFHENFIRLCSLLFDQKEEIPSLSLNVKILTKQLHSQGDFID